MDILFYILIFTFIGSILSLVGGIILLFNSKFALKISHFLASFAAGTLLGTAFFDLLPEANEESGEINIFFWTLVGLLSFFLLERFVHHHNDHPEEGRAIVPLIMIGDSIHNFIDGVAIAATFLINIPLGIVTTLAVAAHEIPQEIGDFGLMLSRGINKTKVLLFNFYTALASLLGAILTFYFADLVEGLLPIVLSLTAGFFIYIASSGLIPEIHSRENKKIAALETILLFLGVFTIYILVSLLEGLH